MKRNRITYGFLVLAAILAFTVGSKNATAVPIDGTIGFGGVVTPVNSDWDPVAIEDAVGIKFNWAFVTSADGDFDVIPVVNSATYTNFQFSPLAPSPVDPLWTTTSGINTAEFKMTSVSITQQTVDNIDLAGTGILRLTGFSNTFGIWAFSSNAAGTMFLFSATSAAVPEPATLSLLGIGLIGLVGVGVRRKMKKEENA